MSGIFQAFNVAKLGMQVQQYAVNTTSHNISNANTEGFSRQRVNLQTTQPFSYAGIGQLGTGVEVVSITRTRDELLDAQIRFENAIEGRFESGEAALEQVEMILLEPSDTGLNSTLGEFWNSWQELSKTPENVSAKTIVAQGAVTLTGTVNHLDGQMETLKADLTTLQTSKVYDANVLLGQINDMNDQIYRVNIKGMEPNDLMDRRDLLVDRLSSIINIETSLDKNGSMEITNRETGKILLDVNPKEPAEMEMSVVQSVVFVEGDTDGEWHLTVSLKGDPTDIHTVKTNVADYTQGDVIFTDPREDWNDGTVILTKPDLKEGALVGNTMAMTDISNYQDQLDLLVNGIAQAVNKIHNPDGVTVDFFTGQEGEPFTAENISVNAAILQDENLVQAGAVLDGPAGDGSRALAIAQLRNGRFDMAAIGLDLAGYDAVDMSVPSNAEGTFDSFYKGIIATVGIDTQSAQRGLENQETLLLQLNQRKESISGVSIDEEVANLIQYQTAYQANARVMSTLTQMLDTLLNGLFA
ncbi:MAG: flagellar hook-associated protein FlgK [Peptostreptococcaceae bacterium]|nr:flagellar hook-associated protein FlgK [Peptostreptococcaceae bacterium]